MKTTIKFIFGLAVLLGLSLQAQTVDGPTIFDSTGSYFTNSYTVAQLPTPVANHFQRAYCTDMLTPLGTGGWVKSDGTKWMNDWGVSLLLM